MSSKKYTIVEDKEYVEALLESLDEKKRLRQINMELYDKLREKYTKTLNSSSSRPYIREGFVTLEAIIPDVETLYTAVEKLKGHLQALDAEKTKLNVRLGKLDELLNQNTISEDTYRSKKREYETMVSRINEEEKKLTTEIPNTLNLVQPMIESISVTLEELDVQAVVEGRSINSIKQEKKRLESIKRSALKAVKELSKISKVDFDEKSWATKTPPPPPPRTKATKHAIKTSLSEDVERKQPRKLPDRQSGQITWAKWKNMIIGRYIGEITIIGSRHGVIATDRPSLALQREIALTGPSQLRSTTNPKTIEARLSKLVVDSYGVSPEESLIPEHLINYCIENKIGVDLLKLMNSYFATVSAGTIKEEGGEILINDNVQLLSIAESSELLGRRILAPDRSLIGVIHEIYLDPASMQLYAFAFKGVPPPIIRKIYRDTHNQNLSEGTFSDFRNEISKKLSIPIYEALTPPSMIKFALLSGAIANINQLVSVIESMNPRVSKAVDIRSISAQGILLTRFPQNSLPKIEIYKM
ncbi:MAG: hypothetical protein ACTSPK_07410 [Candidatus Heimdallarchaeota archaeon]